MADSADRMYLLTTTYELEGEPVNLGSWIRGVVDFGRSSIHLDPHTKSITLRNRIEVHRWCTKIACKVFIYIGLDVHITLEGSSPGVHLRFTDSCLMFTDNGSKFTLLELQVYDRVSRAVLWRV